jgi:arylsulfatase A-like enzyme
MPSNMEGAKSLPYDGGIRNFLAVQGPGVQAGVVDSTLLGLVDILPTVADLAGMATLTRFDQRSCSCL